MSSADLSDELSCSICLDKYTDPVSLQCGHNFCQSCMKSVLDTQERCSVYSCPECRTEYRERPILERNRKLCNIMECYMLTHMVKEKNNVFCTYCDFTEPAVKMCLQCETIFCSKHLRHHDKMVDHLLIDPTTSLEYVKCSTHNKMMKYYCSEDKTCVCVSCFAAGEHRGHLVKSIDEVLEQKKETIKQLLETIMYEKAEAEKCLQRMRTHEDKVQKDASLITERVNGLFEEIREQLDVLKKRVLGEVNRQADEIHLQVSNLVQQIKTKADKLSQNIDCIQDICNSADPFCVLREQASAQVFKTVSGDDKTSHPIGDLNEGVVLGLLHTGLWRIVTDLKKNIHLEVYSPLIMDVNTAHNKMALSVDLKTTSDSDINHRRPDSSSRFSIYNQAMSVNSFTGQQYWQVEVSTTGIWDIGLAYSSIERDGKQSGIGDNDKSWCLRKYTKRYMAAHNSKAHSLLHEQSSQVIGIFLDYEAGRLSFYEVCDPVKSFYRHIHTFMTTFTEPLYAVVYVDDGAWVKVM